MLLEISLTRYANCPSWEKIICRGPEPGTIFKVWSGASSNLPFNEEKEEVISKLMAHKIEFNTYDYAIDNIFRDVQSIDVMEQYGSSITGQ